MTVGALLPSEVARLVLGYLESESCAKAYDHFLYECKHLEECRGRDFFTTIMGSTLLDMLNDYCAIHSYVLRFKCEDELKKKLSRCFCLLDKIILILQSIEDNVIRLDHGTSLSAIERRDAQVQTNIRSRSSSLDSVRTIQSHKYHSHSTSFEISSKKNNNHRLFAEHVNRSIESTSLTDLPGHKADFETVDNKFRNSLTKSSDPISTIEIDNHEIDFPYSLGLIRNTVSPDRLKKNSPTKRKSKNGRPISPKKYMTITNAILDCTELHEAIANNINQVINLSANKSDMVELDITKVDKEESLNLKDSSKNVDETFVDDGKQLEGTIKMIVEKTEKDPIFEQLVEELLASEYDSDIVSRADTSTTEKSCPSEKNFLSPIHSPEASAHILVENTIKNRLRTKKSLPRNSYLKRRLEMKKTDFILKDPKVKNITYHNKKKAYQKKRLNNKKNVNETKSKKTIIEDYVDNVEKNSDISESCKGGELKHVIVKSIPLECNSNNRSKSTKHDDASVTLECNRNDQLNSIKCDDASASLDVTKNEEERCPSSSNMTKNKLIVKLCDECRNIDESNSNILLADKLQLSKIVPSKSNQKVIILSNERVQTNIVSNNGSFIFDSKQKIHQGNVKSDTNSIKHSTSSESLKRNQFVRNDKKEISSKNRNDNLQSNCSNVHENLVKSENNVLSECIPVVSYFDNSTALNRSESYFSAIPGTSQMSVSSVEFGNKVSSSIKQNTKQKIISGKPPELLICNKLITNDEKTYGNEILYTESEIMKMPTVVFVKPMELQTGISVTCSQNHNILTSDMSNQTLYISNNNSNLSNKKSLPPKKSFFLSKENTEQDGYTYNFNNPNRVFSSVDDDLKEYVDVKLVDPKGIQELTQENINILETDSNINTGFEFFNHNGENYSYVENEIVVKADASNEPLVTINSLVHEEKEEPFSENLSSLKYESSDVISPSSFKKTIKLDTIVIEETPDKIISKKTCLSTPTKKNSHVRVLDFGTPEHHISERKAVTASKILDKSDFFGKHSFKSKSRLFSPIVEENKSQELQNSEDKVNEIDNVISIDDTEDTCITDHKITTINGLQVNNGGIPKKNPIKNMYKNQWDYNLRSMFVISEDMGEGDREKNVKKIRKKKKREVAAEEEDKNEEIVLSTSTEIEGKLLEDALLNRSLKGELNADSSRNGSHFEEIFLFEGSSISNVDSKAPIKECNNSDLKLTSDKIHLNIKKSISPKKSHVKSKTTREKNHKLKNGVKSKKKPSVLSKNIDILRENAIKLGAPKSRKSLKHKSTFKVKIGSKAYSENLIKKSITDDSIKKKDVCRENKSKNNFKSVANCLEYKNVMDIKKEELSLADKNQEKEIHITPELPKEYRSQPVDVRCNLSSLLETPFKRNLLDISIATPKFLSPFENSDPMSLIKCLGIPTPRFDDTPSPKCSGIRNSPGSHSSKQTGYSSGSSYYKPDEIEFDDKEITKHVIKKLATENIPELNKNGSFVSKVTNTSSMVLRPRKSNSSKLIERRYLEKDYKKVSKSNNVDISDQKSISQKSNINLIDEATESLVKTPKFDKRLNSSTPAKVNSKLSSDNVCNPKINNENILSVSNAMKLNTESFEEKKKRIVSSFSTTKENYSVKQVASKKLTILGRHFGNKCHLKKSKISCKSVKLNENNIKNKSTISTCTTALKKETIASESKDLYVNIETIAKSRRKSSTPRKFEKISSCDDALQLDIESKLGDFYSTPLNQNQELSSYNSFDAEHLNTKTNLKKSNSIDSHFTETMSSNNVNQKSKQSNKELEIKETIDIMDSSSDSSSQSDNTEILNPIEVLDSPFHSNNTNEAKKCIDSKVTTNASHSDMVVECNNEVIILSTCEITSISKNKLTSNEKENVPNENISSFNDEESNLESVSSTLDNYSENLFGNCTDKHKDVLENTLSQKVGTEKRDQTETENIFEPVIEGEDDDVIVWSNFECANSSSNYYNYVFDVDNKKNSHIKYTKLKDNLDNFALNLNIYDSALNADQIRTIKSSQYFDLFEIEINTKLKKKIYNKEYKSKYIPSTNKKNKKPDLKETKNKGFNSIKTSIDEASDSSNEGQLVTSEFKNNANIENDSSDSETCTAVKNLLSDFKSHDNTKVDIEMQNSIVDDKHCGHENCENACKDLMTYALIAHKETQYVDKRKHSDIELDENSAKKLKPEFAQHILQQIDIEAVLSSLHGPV